MLASSCAIGRRPLSWSVRVASRHQLRRRARCRPARATRATPRLRRLRDRVHVSTCATSDRRQPSELLVAYSGDDERPAARRRRPRPRGHKRQLNVASAASPFLERTAERRASALPTRRARRLPRSGRRGRSPSRVMPAKLGKHRSDLQPPEGGTFVTARRPLKVRVFRQDGHARHLTAVRRDPSFGSAGMRRALTSACRFGFADTALSSPISCSQPSALSAPSRSQRTRPRVQFRGSEPPP